MKRLLSFLLFLQVFSTAYSQELPNIVPPSPEATSLAKFTDVPVSHYTGIPNISVPIFTLKQKGISIPISLSYHARGIQVSEIASRVGLGWALNYGGSVSRQVRGKADEAGYLGNKITFENYSSDPNIRSAAAVGEIFDSNFDYYPDQFNFNIGGVSGKFILDYSTEEVIIQGFDDIKIGYTQNDLDDKIESFTIIDSNGNTYYFGIPKYRESDLENEGVDYQQSVGKSIYIDNVVEDPAGAENSYYYSAWKLMDIETIYGEVISFYYEKDTDPGSYYRKSFDKHETPPGSVPNSASNMDDISKIHTRISQVWNYEKRLRKIEFNQQRDSIVFEKSQNKRDDFDGYALDRILVYGNNKLIKSYQLDHSYTTSTDTSNQLDYFINNTLFEKYFKRMFLDRVVEVDSLGNELAPYIFTYDKTEALPSAFSSKQDYWGYYNGASNNGPFTRMFDYGTYVPNRRVDTLLSEVGILKEIKYPTGGKTRLIYEHNKGSVPLEFKDLKIPAISPISNSFNEIVLSKDDFMYDSTTDSYEYAGLTFPDIQVTYNVSCFHPRVEGDTTTPDCVFDFYMNSTPMDVGTNVTFNGSSGNTYTLTVNPLITQITDKDFTITISYNLPDNRNLLYGAGKRIKRIENISKVGDTLIKEFEYHFPPDQPGVNPIPSGAIVGLPAYLNMSSQFNNVIANYNDVGSSFSSFQPNSIGYSCVIEYQGEKGNDNGKTEYYFTNLSDSGGDYYNFPYHPPTDNEWLRGKNVLTKLYKKETNGEYNIVKEIYNRYLYGNNEYTSDFINAGLQDPNFIFTPGGTIHNWEVNTPLDKIKNRSSFKLPLFMRERAPLSIEDPSFNPVTDNTGYRIYHLTGGTVDLLSTTETNYFDNGLEHVSQTKYYYNYDNHYQLAEQETVNSKKDTLVTKMFYPNDIEYTTDLNYGNLENSGLTAIESLKAQHRLSIPIQTETFKNGNILSAQRTNFDNFNGVIEPATVQVSKAGLGLEDRIVYHNYDSKGNPIEVSKADGTHITYIWGYNQTQPIAKIENATYSEVITALSELSIPPTIAAIQADSNNDIDSGSEDTLRDSLSSFREALPNAQVTTITYDPLVGVTSVTDPKGYTMYYKYDSFNRLEYIIDADGNYLNKYEYHYYNQAQ